MNKLKESSEEDYRTICENIAKDIGLLKDKFPQLKEFNVSNNLDKESCKLRYEYRCHRSNYRGGWTSGVPNPDQDGIWFYIGIWDENDPTESLAQINTQPLILKGYIKNRRVTFLILEGDKTSKISPDIYRILENHGIKYPELQNRKKV